MKKAAFIEAFTELIRRAATDLPADVEEALSSALQRESGPSKEALHVVLQNVRLARERSAPICQDTGIHTWSVRYPRSMDPAQLFSCVIAATRKATRLGYLRPNAVDSVTGTNSEDNTGIFHPIVELLPWEKDLIAADLLLKGGGSENVSAQMSLPDPSIGAGRDLDGVRKGVLKMVCAAQGSGCSPGVVGVCIGGDRQTGYKTAKGQLKRVLSDRNRDPLLAELEETLLREANELGIGPMGFGGKTTLLGVKVAKVARHPASFFVTVAYSCWALRRWSLKMGRDGSKVTFTQRYTT